MADACIEGRNRFSEAQQAVGDKEMVSYEEVPAGQILSQEGGPVVEIVNPTPEPEGKEGK